MEVTGPECFGAGPTLRLTDVDGGANVAALFYNYEDRLERYNMADTLKAQHTAYLTQGLRLLLRHGPDPLLHYRGHLRLARYVVLASRMPRWSRTSTAGRASRNSATTYYKNGYDRLLNELGKYGLGKRDIVANVNFFSKVTVGDEGTMHFQPGARSRAATSSCGSRCTRWWCCSTCQHPARSRARPIARDHVRLAAFASARRRQRIACRTRCPENERGFRNTEMLYPS